MKKSSFNLLFLLLALFTLASCEKDEPNLNVGPKMSIVFDDAIDKTTADYKIGSTLTLKIRAEGASTVSIITNYTTGTVRTANLGTFPVTNGVATVTIPANSLRAAADGAPVGARATADGAPVGAPATAATRPANTYTLTVDATGNGVTERRFFTAVLVQPKINIVFDDAFDKTTADYKIGSTLTLKISAAGATTVSIVSNYTTGTVRTVNLGTFPVTNGVATVTIPANSLRAAADGAPVGATSTASTRPDNTYTLTVEATGNGETERRFFTAVLVQ
ncbi:hypothetical protein [Hymenobacter glacialis]|uniref:DUF1735 domain-containing protein n=1 Tax=Hymenobacter glacialis TaxID=1908236 RepID=A0A1G1SUT6_9BACT|nr:hypothetical protein [Hymenobacter glacialis]OGX82376.1 hypothetical protein BEN48_05375 [Hymenobacter glacialis]